MPASPVPIHPLPQPSPPRRHLTSRESRKRTVPSIPNDIFLEISPYLSIADRLHLSLTSKRVREAIPQTSAVLRSYAHLLSFHSYLFSQHDPHRQRALSLRSLTIHPDTLEDLDAEAAADPEVGEDILDRLFQIIQASRNILRLDIGYPDFCVETWVAPAPSGPNAEARAREPLSHLTKLIHYRVYHRGEIGPCESSAERGFYPHGSSIRKLSICGKGEGGALDLEGLIDSLHSSDQTSLESLAIETNTTLYTSDDGRGIDPGPSLPSVHQLTLEFLSENDLTATELLYAMPNLRTLHVIGTRSFPRPPLANEYKTEHSLDLLTLAYINVRERDYISWKARRIVYISDRHSSGTGGPIDLDCCDVSHANLVGLTLRSADDTGRAIWKEIVSAGTSKSISWIELECLGYLNNILSVLEELVSLFQRILGFECPCTP